MTIGPVWRDLTLLRFLLAAWCILLSTLVGVGAPAAAEVALAFHPVEVEHSRATVARHALELLGPNEPDAPTVWEGPIRVTGSSGDLACMVDAELITGLFADSSGRALLVISRSGAATYLTLFDLDHCSLAAPSEAVFTDGIDATGERIAILPGCECAGSAQICSCSAGKVLRVDADLQMQEDVLASRELTRAHLGVAFSGEARVAEPGSARARIVDN